MSVNYWLTASGTATWSGTANWSLGTAPATGDDVVVNFGSCDISAGLSATSVTLASLTIGANFSGTLGTSGVGTTSYLQIGATIQTINAAGSGRIKINTGTLQTTATVIGTSSSSSDSGLEPVRLIGTHASNKLYVLGGTVGTGTTNAGEAATWSEVDLSNDPQSVLNIGAGVTLTTVNCAAGTLTFNSAATTVTTSSGGNIFIYGSGAITTANVGGQIVFNERGNAVTTLNLYNNGVADFSQNPAAITVTTLNQYGGSQFLFNAASPNHVTVTTRNNINTGSLTAG